jgi:hypothetical protein
LKEAVVEEAEKTLMISVACWSTQEEEILIVATPSDIAAGFGSNNLVLHARIAIPTHPSITFSQCTCNLVYKLHPVRKEEEEEEEEATDESVFL